ncbi:hypothetical protein B0H16DRAFT_1466178 [Mycena metata]|uniref:Uncharacterized protein n=1 Tax=Mycena metata TaxID=1033252 RepID=A0AAD7MXN4_9AGAR|nr:hypothetical protein B0H16DRAFT_1466178 [Mycena metata]
MSFASAPIQGSLSWPQPQRAPPLVNAKYIEQPPVNEGRKNGVKNENTELSFYTVCQGQLLKSVHAKILSGHKKKCCSGSGYFAAGWLCCRALEETERRKVLRWSRTQRQGLDQFEPEVFEIFRDGDDSGMATTRGVGEEQPVDVEQDEVLHECRGQLPEVPQQWDSKLFTVPHGLLQTIAKVPHAASATAAACSTIAAGSAKIAADKCRRLPLQVN